MRDNPLLLPVRRNPLLYRSFRLKQLLQYQLNSFFFLRIPITSILIHDPDELIFACHVRSVVGKYTNCGHKLSILSFYTEFPKKSKSFFLSIIRNHKF